MPLIKAIDFKKINLNQIISVVILVVALLISIKIFQGENKKNAQIKLIQNEQRKKNEILLRITDKKSKIELYKESLKPRDKRDIINKITNLARAAGVKINSLKPQEQRSSRRMAVNEIYNKMFFNLAIEVSGYHQLGKFITSLESDLMMFVVESLQIERDLVRDTNLIDQPKKLQVGLLIMELFFK